jgi:magnesium-transporting ATPase (P-type)
MALLIYLLLIGFNHFNIVEDSQEHITIIFNVFVLCQVFNEINARSIGDDMNVFKGLFENPIFIAIVVFTLGAQYAIVEFGGDFVKTAPLSVDQWIKCFALAACTLPVGNKA